MTDNLLKAMRTTFQANGKDVDGVLRQARRLALYYRDVGVEKLPIAAFHQMLEMFAEAALVEECEQVIEDMKLSYGSSSEHKKGEDDGGFVDVSTLNRLLKAAVKAKDQSQVETTLDRIRHLPVEKQARDSKAAADHPGSVGPGIAISRARDPEQEQALLTHATRNFNSETYTLLFENYYDSSLLEAALILFGTLARSASTPQLAFNTYLQPRAVQALVRLCLVTREYQIAVDIASWLQQECGSRLITPAVWIEIARRSAGVGFQAGVLAGYRHGLKGRDASADGGLLLSALATASAQPDVKFCHELIRDALAGSPEVMQHSVAGLEETGPPKNVINDLHLNALLDAYCQEERFEEAVRLLGVMRSWKMNIDYRTASMLQFKACKDLPTLLQAVDGWRRVLTEGGFASAADRAWLTKRSDEPGKAPSAAPSSSSHDDTDKRFTLIERAASGQIPALCGQVERESMNALIGACAVLGETDAALAVWEDARRYARGRQGLLPNSDTFDELIKACLTRQPYPSPRLALSVFNEMLYYAETAATSGASEGQSSLSAADEADEPPEERSGAFLSTAAKRRMKRQRAIASVLTTSTFRPPTTSTLPKPPLSDGALDSAMPSCAPTHKTFEHLISIYSTADAAATRQGHEANIRVALKFLEEAKARKIMPSRVTYEVLIRAIRVLVRKGEAVSAAGGTSAPSSSSQRQQRGDVRWKVLLQEMTDECGYTVPRALQQWLDSQEGWVKGQTAEEIDRVKQAEAEGQMDHDGEHALDEEGALFRR